MTAVVASEPEAKEPLIVMLMVLILLALLIFGGGAIHSSSSNLQNFGVTLAELSTK